MITHTIIVLDKSGSMQSAREGTIKGFNELIQQIKLDSKEGKEIKTSLVTFNAGVFEHFWELDAESLQEITHEDYVPAGGTAMRDALGYTLNKVFGSEQPKDIRYDLTVITDGETNTDRTTTQEALKELLDSCNKAGNWTITWVGCSQESALKAARDYNIPVGNMASYTVGSNSGAELAFKGLREARRAYYSSDLKACTTAFGEGTAVTDWSEGNAGTTAGAVVTTTDSASVNLVIDNAKNLKRNRKA